MRLINADKIYPDVRTQHGALAISQGQLAYAETVNAILIPDNATNGDVIKAMFPNIEEQMIDLVMRCGTSVMSIGNDVWWNSPYQKGGK